MRKRNGAANTIDSDNEDRGNGHRNGAGGGWARAVSKQAWVPEQNIVTAAVRVAKTATEWLGRPRIGVTAGVKAR